MDHKELYEQVGMMLSDFENLESIHPSDEWSTKLLTRINNSKMIPSGLTNRFNILVLLLLLVNTAFIVKVFYPFNNNTITQDQSFHTISKAIFINPIPANQ